MIEADVIILGGGCAGLSLACRLADFAARGNRIPQIIVLERRRAYVEDRTWCFWHERNQPLPYPVAARWSRWRFSSGKTSRLHSSDAWEYVCLRSSDMYNRSVDKISDCDAINLNMGVQVTGVESVNGRHHIQTDDGTYRADTLIDCRTPDRSLLEQANLHQIFLGVEFETEAEETPHDVVGLMEEMSVDSDGFHFRYHLPISPRRHLIEATRFSSSWVDPDRLSDLLDHYLSSLDGPFRIVRKEKGVIPMGFPAQKDSRSVIAGGTRGGAVRPSSGYAFHRIQQWADTTAAGLVENKSPAVSDSRVRSGMDTMFLRALKHAPEHAPDWFLRLAEHVSPDSFARFMTDQGTVGDHLNVIRALPAIPFVRSALGRSA